MLYSALRFNRCIPRNTTLIKDINPFSHLHEHCELQGSEGFLLQVPHRGQDGNDELRQSQCNCDKEEIKQEKSVDFGVRQ